nr:retrovirus-related Pol polyprotein from transposon TNT 1-94 [Tanacetum cinerariifolium]
FLGKRIHTSKESGRTVELDDEDTIPSENTSNHLIEVKSLAPIIEEDVVPVRRSARTPKAPNRLCLNVEIVPDQLYFNFEVEEHSLGDKAYYDYEIWQMDVKTAFLNAFLDEEIYME